MAPKAVVEGSQQGGFIPAGPVDPLLLADRTRLAVLGAGLGTRAELEYELDRLAAAVRTFYDKEPDQVMRECSAYSARLVEMANLLVRAETYDRQYKSLRTLQVDRLLAELDRQFKLHSRMVELRRQDLALMSGT